MKQMLLVVVTALFAVTYSNAQTPDEDVKIGMELMKQEKFDSAFNHFMAAANHKNYEGMYFAGNMYHLGVGTAANRERAYFLLRTSADSGSYPRAYEALGNMYYQDKKMDSAKYYLEKSMEFTNTSAGTLGAIYFDDGESRKALRLFKEGAAAEDPVSMYYLGQMYYDGEEMEPNEKEAVRWLQRSAKKGYQPAQAYLEDIGYDDLEDLDEMDKPQKRSKVNREKSKKVKRENTTEGGDEEGASAAEAKRQQSGDDNEYEATTPRSGKKKKSKNPDQDDHDPDEE